MKNNELKYDKEFEVLLKEKMDALSGSVNCFDKIASKSFPESNRKFDDSELIISDLENVSGKAKHFSIIKLVSAAAVVLLVAGLVPNLIMSDNLKDKLAKQAQKNHEAYENIISEIEAETGSGYTTIDVPLDYYIKNDVLITPLFPCPFEDSEEENVNVRIYIKTCNNIQTNQVYAVEYKNLYAEKNFIAAAESNAKFTDSELEVLRNKEFRTIEKANILDAENCFMLNEGNQITDSEGNTISAAFFSGKTFFKDKTSITDLNYSVMYYHKYNEDTEHYYYDLNTFCEVLNYSDWSNVACSEYQLPEQMWADSFYCNGSTAFPEHSESDFERITLSDKKEYLTQNSRKFCALFTDEQLNTEELLQNNDYTYFTRKENLSIESSSLYSFSEIYNIRFPFQYYLRKNFALLLPDLTGTSSVVITNNSANSHSEYSCSSDKIKRSKDYTNLYKLSDSDFFTEKYMEESESAEKERIQNERESKELQMQQSEIRSKENN